MSRSAQNLMMLHALAYTDVAAEIEERPTTVRNVIIGHLKAKGDLAEKLTEYFQQFESTATTDSLFNSGAPELVFNLEHALAVSQVNAMKFKQIFCGDYPTSYALRALRAEKLTAKKAKEAFTAITEAGYNGTIESLMLKKG